MQEAVVKGRAARDRVDCDREFERVEMEMDARRLLPVCVVPIALVLVAGVARAQTQEQHPGGAPSEPALELPAGEPWICPRPSRKSSRASGR